MAKPSYKFSTSVSTRRGYHILCSCLCYYSQGYRLYGEEKLSLQKIFLRLLMTSRVR